MTVIINPPYFLVGAERSGSTMLRLMLDHHPEIFFHHEFEYSVNQIDFKGQFPGIEDYREFLDSDRIFKSDGIIIPEFDNYVEIVKSFLVQLHDKNMQKHICGATVHHNFQFLSLIWPNAKYIHLIRDPRDVTVSYVKKGWAGHVWTAADMWLLTENIWQDFSQKLSDENFINVYYEDLVRNPEVELSKICQFIGVSYSKEMLNYAGSSTFSSPDISLINQWKNSGNKVNNLVESKLEMLMKQYNYLDGNKKIEKISFFYDYYLRIFSHINKVLFFISRYGLTLKFLDYLSRRVFKSCRFRKYVKEKVNNKAKLYIK